MARCQHFRIFVSRSARSCSDKKISPSETFAHSKSESIRVTSGSDRSCNRFDTLKTVHAVLETANACIFNLTLTNQFFKNLFLPTQKIGQGLKLNCSDQIEPVFEIKSKWYVAFTKTVRFRHFPWETENFQNFGGHFSEVDFDTKNTIFKTEKFQCRFCFQN